MLKSKYRNLLFTAASITLGLILLEGMAYLSYFITFKQQFTFSQVASERNAIVSQNDAREKSKIGEQEYVLHPYYGYVQNTNEKGPSIPPPSGSLATYGFDSGEQLLQDYYEDKFVVAITGGSVAKYFSAYSLDTLREYIIKLPEAKGKNIIFLPLAFYAYKQPQQLLIVSDILAQGARINVLINLDGFNEVALPVAHNLPIGVSPFFPSGWRDRSQGMLSKQSALYYGKRELASEAKTAVASFFHGLPQWSVTLNFIWKTIDNILNNLIISYERGRQLADKGDTDKEQKFIKLDQSGRIDLGPAEEMPLQDFYPESARQWALCSALLRSIVESNGGSYFHFLQPNQYDIGSKPLAPIEKEKAYNPNQIYKTSVEKGYPLLKKAGEALREAGVNFYDMSRVFETIKDPLYNDDCCHFNKEGLNILAGAIGHAIMDRSFEKPVPEGSSLRQIEDLLSLKGVINSGKRKRLAEFRHDLMAEEEGQATATMIDGLYPLEKNTQNPEERWRWGLGPKTVVKFLAPIGTKVTLKYMFTTTLPSQTVRIENNGKTIASHTDIPAMSESTRQKSLIEEEKSFVTEKEVNIITIGYSDWNHRTNVYKADDPRHLAVVFYKLQIQGALPQ